MIEPFQVWAWTLLDAPRHLTDIVHQMTFAVPMTCESCVEDISRSINKLPGGRVGPLAWTGELT